MSIKKINRNIWEKYYIILCALYALSVFRTSLRVGVILSLIMILMLILNFNKVRYVSKPTLAVFLYIGVCLVSYIWMIGGNKTSNYATAITYTILPFIFYFYAQKVDDKQKQRFWDITINALFVAMIIGFVLYLWAPSFYGHFLVDKGYSSNYLKGWIRSTFQGIFGVTCTGSFCAILSAYELEKVLSGEKKRIVRLVTCVVLLLLTARKSAILGFAIIVFLELVYMAINKRIKFGIVILVGIIMIIGYFVFQSKFNDVFVSILNRFTDIRGDLNTRNQLGTEIISKMQSVFTGNGFGSSGHIAGSAGALNVINDNSYQLIFVETGIIGLLSFGVMMFIGLLNGVINSKKCYFELLILCLLAVQAIGSNVFEFQQLMPIFWFCLGCCNKGDSEISFI